MEQAEISHEYDSTLWHTRLFLWSHKLWHMFLYGDEPRKVERTNICHYVHTFGLMLIALFSQILFWAAVTSVFGILPTYLFGHYGAVKVFGVVAFVGGGVAFFIGIVWSVVEIVDRLERRNERKGRTQGPRFMKVFQDWIRAKKEKTCWQIAIVYPENNKKAQKGEA